MPFVDENGEEWFDLFDKADLELMNRAWDELPEPDSEPEPED